MPAGRQAPELRTDCSLTARQRRKRSRKGRKEEEEDEAEEQDRKTEEEDLVQERNSTETRLAIWPPKEGLKRIRIL